MNDSLNILKSEAFEERVGYLLSPAAVRKRLCALPEVQQAITALTQGASTEEDLRRFVSTLMAEFRAGQRFPYDVALAALAVVLERRVAGFADEYLRDLARLKLAEMPVSIRFARECLKHRAGSLARNHYKRHEYRSASDPLAPKAFEARSFARPSGAPSTGGIPSREYNGAPAC